VDTQGDQESDMKMFQRILVATDFSPASTPALEQSVKMASETDRCCLDLFIHWTALLPKN